MVADSVIINGVDVGTGKVTKVNITKQQVFSLMKKYGLPELQKYLSENKVKRKYKLLIVHYAILASRIGT